MTRYTDDALARPRTIPPAARRGTRCGVSGRCRASCLLPALRRRSSRTCASFLGGASGTRIEVGIHRVICWTQVFHIAEATSFTGHLGRESLRSVIVTVQALAGSLSYDICLLNLSERGLTDDKLNYLMSNAPERSFILIENVDNVFNKRAQMSEDG